MSKLSLTKKHKDLLCNDITEKWFKKYSKTSKRFAPYQFQNGETFRFRGHKYKYDGKKIYYDFSHGELAFANWLSKKIDKQIIMIPNIDINGGVSAPDYIIDKEAYDLKTIKPTSNGKQPIYNNLRGKIKQSDNFFVDGSYSKYTFEELCTEAIKIFYRNDTSFVNIIVIKKIINLLFIKETKKRSTSGNSVILRFSNIII